ncbi:MAG: redoxin domain-containing protein [Acidimicrobiia bacterium]
MAAWGVVGLTAVLAVVMASRFGSDPGLAESPLLGRPAPDLTLDRLIGSGQVSLSDFHGETVVVNFFASWCLECRIEHEDLVATSDSFADQGVRFVGIAFEDDPADARSYLEEAGMSRHTEYLVDTDSRAAVGFGVFGVPETFFIDPQGTVVGRIVGPTTALALGTSIDSISRGESPGNQILGNTRTGPGDS